MLTKLNLGAGDTVIEGFIPIDRKLGLEAYPLSYEDNSVDEIRASHILEHFGRLEVPRVLTEWVRALKPGGTIRIAVPDFQKLKAQDDKLWSMYLMGGQTDENDFHKSVFDETSLRELMTAVGLVDIAPWTSSNTDCASLPISLNLVGTKAQPKTLAGITQETVQVTAIMSVPRVGWNDAWGQIMESLAPFKIPVRRFSGVFWGQCMQRVLNECVKDGVDWAVTIDYDSLFTAQHLDRLMGWLGKRPEIDAITALQCKRGGGTPLMTIKGQREIEIDGQPVQVDSAHFGLTIIRLDALRDIPKPWFKSVPDKDGGWGDGRIDDDIWFWHQWKEAGKTVYVAPDVRIGHLEVMAAEFDDELKPRHVYVSDWRDEQNKKVKKVTHAN